MIDRLASPFLVITGMHRSNTSMLARLLARNGVAIGSRLVSGDPSNPHGHFEDVEFVRLHEQILRRHGLTWRMWRTPTIVLNPEDYAAAGSLVRSRHATSPSPWGFKVPHATLLLPLWNSFEEARFAFIFRDPFEVFRSLLKRIGRQVYYKPYFAIQMLQTYVVYNRTLLDFYRANEARCYLMHSRDVVARTGDVLNALAGKLEVHLEPGERGDGVDSELLDVRGNAFVERLAGLMATWPQAIQIYRDMRAICDSARVDREGRGAL